MDRININISTQFSKTPGGRFKKQGDFSGEEFREQFLENHFRDLKDNTRLVINLDGTEGYATSFLEEAFGGLVRFVEKNIKPDKSDKYFSIKWVKDRIEFVSIEEKLLIKEINIYIEEANDR